MARISMTPLYGSIRGFRKDVELSTETVTDPITFPDTISFITSTLIVPDGVKAKIQTTTIDEDKIVVADTNLDIYWVDFDLNGTPEQDSNGFITGPVVIQGSIPVVNGMRIVRETGSSDPVILGLRGQ